MVFMVSRSNRIFIQILTIHALLPLSMIFALVGIALLVMQIYSPELEAVAYLVRTLFTISHQFVQNSNVFPWYSKQSTLVFFSPR